MRKVRLKIVNEKDPMTNQDPIRIMILCVWKELYFVIDKQINMINVMQTNMFCKHIIRHVNSNVAVKKHYFLSRLSGYSCGIMCICTRRWILFKRYMSILEATFL